jgi:DNA-binding IclR family transcriptional regulator
MGLPGEIAAVPDRANGQTKALFHGLEALRLLVEAKRPLTATEIARTIGIHQSSASRILKTLAVAGYVRKADYHSFANDFGVLALGATAIGNFAFAHKPRPAMTAIAAEVEGLSVVLATVWRGEIIYFLRMQRGHEPTIFSAGGFPLHLSSPALRLLLELPEEEALALLRTSRERHGWERPTRAVPATEEKVLERARELLKHDCVVLDRWFMPDLVSAAIPIEAPGEPPAALALSGPSGTAPHETILVWLQHGRREVERALRG